MTKVAIFSQGMLQDPHCQAVLSALEVQQRLEVIRVPTAPRTPIERVIEAGRANGLPKASVEGAIIPNIRPVGDDFLNMVGPSVRVLSLPFVGVDGIDTSSARARGIRIARAAGVNAEQTAEHALALLLQVRRELPALDAFVRSGAWGATRPLSHSSVSNQSIGIVGFGHVGQAMLRQLLGSAAAIEVFLSPRAYAGGLTQSQQNTLTVTNQYRAAFGRSPIRVFSSEKIAERGGDLDNLLLAASVKQGHPPLLGDLELARFKPGSVVVNVARAELIEQSALLKALDRGVLFATDVFALEPVQSEDPIVTHPGTRVVTPHVAGAGKQVQAGMFERALTNLLVALNLKQGEVTDWVAL